MPTDAVPATPRNRPADPTGPARAALVTGGTSGIGLATARRLGADGFGVIITGRDAARGAEAVAALTDGGIAARFVRADARDPTAAAAAVAAAEEAFGRLDVLVANAGVGVVAPLIDTPPELLQGLFATNVLGYLAQVQAARVLLARSRPAAIVLVSSDSGVRGDAPLGAYSVTKAAVNMMGRMLAIDLAPEGIRVNVVCPGDTLPGMRYMGPLAAPESSAEDPARWTPSPMGRFAEGHEVAQVIAFLAQSGSSFVDGALLLIDGAASAGHW